MAQAKESGALDEIRIMVPVYNEAKNIKFVLSEIMEHQPNAGIISVVTPLGS